MMYACEMMAMIAEKKAKEDAERLLKALADFQKNLASIDDYVEKKLVAGDGKAKLLIDEVSWGPKGFYYFSKKDYRYSAYCPYWSNERVSKDFPLEAYIQYLRDHCYEVEIIKEPFTAYSSTLKSETTMEGLTLSISAFPIKES